jgi:glycerol-3-phosphate dehydrogenase
MSALTTTPGRDRSIDALGWSFDVLVVGGGINGLAVAWDCALAGLSVVVIDKGDWGSGTSSWSSRMIHGGLKYLEVYDIKLVRESLRDREWLLRRAPHLVKPLPFILPFYEGGVHSKNLLRLGMIAYDVLSFDKSVPRHRTYTRDEILEVLPGLQRDGLQGAAKYYDAQVEYAERLCVEIAVAAREAGAVTLNHARFGSAIMEGNRVVGGRVIDEITGLEHDVRARVTINVTGPWVDDILQGTPEAASRWIGGTKGTHLVVGPFPGAPDAAMYYESDDGRPMMVIPWLGNYLIGSTDKRFYGDLDSVSADEEELEYILYETNKVLPNCGLTRDSIYYWYTGVRPLPYVDAERTADISRRHDIHDHAPKVEGLISVIGGKLTTFRALAKHTLKAISSKIPTGPSMLEDNYLPGYAEVPPARPPHIDDRLWRRLLRIYGARASRVSDIIVSEAGAGDVLDESTGLVVAEVLHAIRQEDAVHLSDVLARRVMVGLEPDLGRGCERRVADVMARELGWDESDVVAECTSYEQYLRRFEVIEESRETPAGH